MGFLFSYNGCFSGTVEPAPGVDLEGLEVAKECLSEVFKIDPSSVDRQADSDLLVNLFSSREASEKQEHKSDLSRETVSADGPSTSSAEMASDANHSEASQPVVYFSSYSLYFSTCL